MLFGSRVRGAVRDDRDVDVGIVPLDPRLSLADELALQERLSRACGLEVDLVRLDGDDLLVGREVARHGNALSSGWPREAAHDARGARRAKARHADRSSRAAARAGRSTSNASAPTCSWAREHPPDVPGVAMGFSQTAARAASSATPWENALNRRRSVVHATRTCPARRRSSAWVVPAWWPRSSARAAARG
ncbi:MAG: nucleotidyltransferase domain-containing protein [Deltaproteobacteria bacterium]|nr:nucleotidyltransferase domain-containing protein [Deltaproteobacteria bacterium]